MRLSRLPLIDSAATLYPHRPLPTEQNGDLHASIAVEQKIQGDIAFNDAHTTAVKNEHASDILTAQHIGYKGTMAPAHDVLDVLVNYGELVEEVHSFNRGWVLTAITLFPGIQVTGAVHNPNALFIDGLDRIRGGNGFAGGSRLAIPFALVATEAILELPISGRMYLHFSVQAASPGAMLVMPRAILRFENWENGLPLEGGNQ